MSADHPRRKVSIVVLNWNNYKDTKDYLTSLRNIRYPNYEVIVVDNGSRDNSLELLMNDFPNHKYIGNSKNLGFAAGNNVGIKRSMENGAQYTLLMNNDTIATDGFLEPLVELIDSDPRIGAVGARIVDLNGTTMRTCARRKPTLCDKLFFYGIGSFLPVLKLLGSRHTYPRYNYDSPRMIFAGHGACLLFRNSAIAEIGLLDENTFLCEEEFILSERMSKRGYTIWIEPKSVVIHKFHKSVEVGFKRSRFWLEYLKSEQYYIANYANWARWKIIILRIGRLLELVVRFIINREYKNMVILVKCSRAILRPRVSV